MRLDDFLEGIRPELTALPTPEQLIRDLQDPGATARRRITRPAERSPGGPPGAPPSRATVVPGASDDALVLEVRSADRPGLLGELGETFAAHGLAIRSAHVATYAGQSLDTFYVMPVPAPPDVARIIAALIDACDGTTTRAGALRPKEGPTGVS